MADRQVKDLAFRTLYAAFIGKIGAVLVGCVALLFVEVGRSVSLSRLAAPAAAYLTGAIVASAVIAIRAWSRWATIVVTSCGVIGSLQLFADWHPDLDLRVLLVALASTVGLLDSLLSNGFLLHNRSLKSRTLWVSATFLFGSTTLAFYWVLDRIVTLARQMITRDQIAALSLLLLLGWIYYLLAAALLVHLEVRQLPHDWVLTQNGPWFNTMHDSLFIVPLTLLAMAPLAWEALGSSEIFGFIGLFLGTFGVAWAVVKFSVKNSADHVAEAALPHGDARASSEQEPRISKPEAIRRRINRQLVFLGAILVAGWGGPLLNQLRALVL